MGIILKRGSEFSPIIFQRKNLQNKLYYRIEELKNNIYGDTKNMFKLDNCLNIQNNFINHIISRRGINYYEFTGGILIEDPIALLVIKNKDRKVNTTYVIANSIFFNINPTYFSRLKRSMNSLGISSRTKLLMWEPHLIISEFLEVHNPTIEDYKSETQEQLSKEFLEYEKTLID